MKKNKFFILMLSTLFLSGCISSGSVTDDDIPEEEKEKQAIVSWFEENADEETFPDLKDYQYYARTLGLDKDHLLSINMWEVYYNDTININRDIDEKTIYLIRLDPNKLLEIFAENNNCSPADICNDMSITPEQFYYNFGYTAGSVGYSANHAKKLADYSDEENSIFGKDNGENRECVFGTHSLVIDLSDYSVTYTDISDTLYIRRRDMLHDNDTNHIRYNYSEYSDAEKNSSFTVNGIGIRSILPLSIPNAWNDATDKDISVMINCSPFAYGCVDENKVDFSGYLEPEDTVTENETASEVDVTVEQSDESEVSK